MRILGFLCLLGFTLALVTGCASLLHKKPNSPSTQSATVTLKAPTISKIPLFWIFPLNMLTWFSEDWYETSQHYVDIKVNDVTLTRFNQAVFNPGQPIDIYTTFIKYYQTPNNTYSDYPSPKENCYGGSSNYKDNSGQTHTVTSGYCAPLHFRETVILTTCHITHTAEVNQQFAVFINDHQLKALNLITQAIESANCSTTSRSYDITSGSRYGSQDTITHK